LTEPVLVRLWIAAAALGLLGLAVVSTVSPPVVSGSGADTAHVVGWVILGLGAASAVVALLSVDPAWPLSIGLAGEMFSGNWDVMGVPVPVDRLLIAVGVLSILLHARPSSDVFGGPPRLVHGALVVAAAYAIVSAVMAGTLDDRDARFALLDRFGLLPFVLFSVAPVAYATERRRRILLGTLVAMAGYLAFTAVAERVGVDALVVPHYITDPSIGIHIDRARGPFTEAVANGMGLFQGAVATVLFAHLYPSRRVRLLAAVIVGASALGLLFTLTRSVWIGSSVALVAAFLSARELRRYLLPGALAVVVGVALATAVIPGLAGDIRARRADQAPVWDRRNSNRAALAMMAQRPLLGFGWFTFADRSADYMRLGPDYPLTRVGLQEHNVYLSHAVELGLVGLVLWAGALLLALGGAILRRGPPELRPWRIALVAIAVQWLVIANFVPLGYAMPTAMLWLWAGIVYPRARRDA
jgi:putative inorganic carbon (hco3(-)) transporter